MDVTKPYKFIGVGAMEATKPYKFIGFGACGVFFVVCPAPGARENIQKGGGLRPPQI